MRPWSNLGACVLLTLATRPVHGADWPDPELTAQPTLIETSPRLTFTPEPPPPPPGPPSGPPDSPARFIHNRDSIPERPAVVFPVDGRYELTMRAGLGGSAGSVAITRSGLTGNIVIGPEHDVQISIPVDYETSTYSFRDADALFPGGVDRLRNVYQWTITPNVEAKISEHWGVFGGGLLFIAGQSGAHETATYGGFGGAIWRPGPSFTLRLGLGARTRLEDDIQILPALWVEWRIDERTRLGSQGNNIRFEYDISEAWTIKFDAAYEQRAYRFDNDGAGPGAVFRDSQVPLTVRLEFVPHAATRFEVWAGCNLDREFVVDVREGEGFSRSHASPSLLLGASFEIIF